MIRITCTNCKAQLSIDEAFAGGACRCQYCGTIQTVPKHMGNPGASVVVQAKAGAGNGAPKALYRDKMRVGADAGSGLDAIAEIVASSGLSGSGLSSSGLTSRHDRRKPPLEPADVAPVVANPKLLPILVGSAVLIVLLLGIVIGLLMKGGGGNGGGNSADSNGAASNTTLSNASPAPAIGDTNADSNVTPSPAPANGSGPVYLGVKIDEPTIIFLLDRGSGTHATFDYMKIACLNAVETLRPGQKFQVIFWRLDREKDPVVYPKSPVSPSQEELKRCATALDDVSSYGQSDVKSALQNALAGRPGAIVLVTGKPVDESFAKAVLDIRKDNPVRIHCLSLGESSSAAAMRDIASRTGGNFRLVSMEELKSVTR